MTSLDLFQGLLGTDSKLEIYTSANHKSIPGTEGCYAWFLPLWMFGDDLEKFILSISRLLHHDPEPVRTKNFTFQRDTIKLSVEKSVDTSVHNSHKETWNQFMTDPSTKNRLQDMLLETSLFMPPLYIGRTKNLNVRYNQHINGSAGKNDFYYRFSSYVNSDFFKIEVSDLLFVCLQTKYDSLIDARLDTDEEKMSELIEHILIRLCRPSFSKRG